MAEEEERLRLLRDGALYQDILQQRQREAERRADRDGLTIAERQALERYLMSLEDLRMKNYLKMVQAQLLSTSYQAAVRQEEARKELQKLRSEQRSEEIRAAEELNSSLSESQFMGIEDALSESLRIRYRKIEQRKARWDAATKPFTPYFSDNDDDRYIGKTRWTPVGSPSSSSTKPLSPQSSILKGGDRGLLFYSDRNDDDSKRKRPYELTYPAAILGFPQVNKYWK